MTPLILASQARVLCISNFYPRLLTTIVTGLCQTDKQHRRNTSQAQLVMRQTVVAAAAASDDL